MTSTAEALRLIETLQKHGIKKQAATEIIGFVEKQQGDLATRQDLEPLKRDVSWIKWIVGIGFTAIPVVLLTVITYLHSDTKSEMKELKAEMKEIRELLQSR